MPTVYLFVLIVLHCSYGQRENKFFRKDYHLIEQLETFYKIHTIPRTWLDAKKICEWEGATLFYPENETEAAAVLAYVKQEQDYNQFWIGISSLLATGVFETIDGLPIMDVYSKWNRGEPNNRGGGEHCVVLSKRGSLNDKRCWNKQPYVCKKTLTSLEWNIPCNMPYIDYKYNETLGRCYKFHTTPRNWTEAYAICSSELSFLAIIESQAEADFLLQLINVTAKTKVYGDYLSGVVHLGFHNMIADGWETIKGTVLEDSGYSIWGGGQPDGGDVEKCGSMFYDGQLNDLACNHRSFFICKHDDDVMNDGINIRFQSISDI